LFKLISPLRQQAYIAVMVSMPARDLVGDLEYLIMLFLCVLKSNGSGFMILFFVL